jgi:hypothetical protein
VSCTRDYWSELDPDGDHEDRDERSYEALIGGPDDFKAVWEELGEIGDHVDLAEQTGRWMRLADHAARLRAGCLEHGLGERLTNRLVEGYLDAFAPEPDSQHEPL